MATTKKEKVFKTEAQIREEELIEGKDAPLTPQIYGQPISPDEVLDTDTLPKAGDTHQGIEDPLERFISMYQPGELIMIKNFRKHLLQVLEDWRINGPRKNDNKN